MGNDYPLLIPERGSLGPPSPKSARYLITFLFKQATMSPIVDEAIKYQIMLLQDRMAGEDDPAYIRSFVAQIRILKTVQIGKIDELIAIRKKDLKDCKNIIHTDMILAELDSLEWIQQQIAMQT